MSKTRKIALTSMPCDPIHPGHISCLQSMIEAVENNFRGLKHENGDFITVCLVNDDGFLLRKKGYNLIPIEDRLIIVDSIKNGADYVVKFTPTNENDQTVIEGLEKIKPFCFIKGGDRKADENLPEWSICKKINCRIIDGVGKEKKWSSSDYVKRIMEGFNV